MRARQQQHAVVARTPDSDPFGHSTAQQQQPRPAAVDYVIACPPRERFLARGASLAATVVKTTGKR